MVWIHGGAFINGNSSYEQYGPDYLLEENVVFVSLNYRLGIFGFISTGDKECLGNWGMKDQVLALEWVQNNIAIFGGNPGNVTIFGESAGAVCVSYLLQTNKTKGLFHKAIMQSGSSLNLWALDRKAARAPFDIAAILGVFTESSSEVITGLREISFATLQSAANLVSTVITLENPLEGLTFGPVIEPAGNESLFVDYSHDLLSKGGFHRIPTILGVNSNEAAAVGTIPLLLRIYLLNYEIQPEDLAPMDLSSSFSTRLFAAMKIESHYFNSLLITASSDKIIQFVSDDQFNRPIREAVIQQSKYAPVYFYKFSYEGLLGGVTINRTLKGVGHAEDLGYIFRRYFPDVSQNDKLIRSRVVRMWTNFAKYGNPTPSNDTLLQNITWQKAGSNSSNLNYLNIASNMDLKQNPFKTSMDFYDDIYNEYGESPYDTY